MEQSRKWPQQTCTTMFFWIPKNVTNERPIALVPPLICWWEALRAPRWRSGSRSNTLIGTLRMAEMEELSRQSGKFVGDGEVQIPSREGELGAVALQRHLSGSVSHWCGPGRHTSVSQGRYCGCCAGTSSTRGECSSKDVLSAMLPGSQWSCLLRRVVLQDALSEATKIYPPLKLRSLLMISRNSWWEEHGSGRNDKEGDEEAKRGGFLKRASNCLLMRLGKKGRAT